MKMEERIADLLKKKGYTQKELAAMVGVTEAAMSKYLKGDRTPRPEIIANLATALDTTSDYLINGTPVDTDIQELYRLVARSADAMTNEEKMEIIRILSAK